jgi:hypothetical protein
LVLALGCAVGASAEGRIGHPADNPHWFDVSPLNHEDVHILASEAAHYAQEGKELGHGAKRDQELEDEMHKKAAEEKRKSKSAPVPNPESTSTKLAVLQQQAALKMAALDDCKAQLRRCSTQDLGESLNSEQKPTAAPRHKIEFPKTTALEDWDETHHGIAPASKPWRMRKGEKIVQEKQTAVEEYEQVQKYMPGDHLPGHKLDHDRIFHSQVKDWAKQAKEASETAVAALQDTKIHHNKEVDTARDAAQAAALDVAHAKRLVAESHKTRTVDQEQAAVADVEKELTACKVELSNCGK